MAAITVTTITTTNNNNNSSNALGDANTGKERKTVRIGKNVDEYELKRMPPILRSKYSFYTEPAAKVLEAQTLSQKRLQQLRKQRIMEREKEIKKIQESNSVYSTSVMSLNGDEPKKLTLEESEELIKFEKERHERLIGQLKAAEARNRTRILKMRYLHSKQDEIDHLIESQPTALKSVRLEAFLTPVQPAKLKVSNSLTPIQKRRLESIVDDSNNSVIDRKLY